MELKNGEHFIYARFFDAGDASDAKNALRYAGITNVHFDSTKRFDVKNRTQAFEGELGNANDMLESAAQVLLASDPSTSKYASERTGDYMGEDISMSVTVAGAGKLNQALKIVQKFGGRV